jgi:hypothetical protein
MNIGFKKTTQLLMTRILIIVVSLLISQTSFGQTDVTRDILEKIDIGFTTRWDIEQLLGKGELIDDGGDGGFGYSHGLQYKDKGITFICAYDREIISDIYLTSPFILELNKNQIIRLGKTSLGHAFPSIDTMEVNTTGGSNYWSFRIDKFIFFVAKPDEHRNKSIYSEVPSFKDNLKYYKKQPISKVIIDLYSYEHYKQEFQEAKNQLYYSKPKYAPKNETHLNCFEMGWPDEVSIFERPFYAMLGGNKSKRIKQGLWKEYGSNHKLIYEGEFKDNKKVGLFKYYNKDGKLRRTLNFSESKFNWIYLLVLGLIIGVLTVMIKKRKLKKGNIRNI